MINYLEKNNIEYEFVSYGNPFYYNDGFTVQAVRVNFNYGLADNIKEMEQKEDKFLKSMMRRKSCCIGCSGKCGICSQWYAVFNVDDLRKYEEHEDRIHADVEKFWKEEHARMMNEGVKTAV